MSSYSRFLDLPLINGEIELDLSWPKEFIIPGTYKTHEDPTDPNATPPYPLLQPTSTFNVTFQINSAKVHSSISDNIKFLKKIKQGFEKTIS